MLGKHEQRWCDNLLFGKMFAENCMKVKVKEIGLSVCGWGRVGAVCVPSDLFDPLM